MKYTAHGYKLCFTSWAGSPCYLCLVNFKMLDYARVQYTFYPVFLAIRIKSHKSRLKILVLRLNNRQNIFNCRGIQQALLKQIIFQQT